MVKISHKKTELILSVFEEIARIPRCSKHEEKICEFMLEWAARHQLVARKDKVGNVVVRVPATPGYENAPVVVLQGHLDMVCEKTPDSTHDFAKDPIRFVYDGEWLKADRTTLGADNGLALAMAMVLAIDRETAHPPLELLFTIDEETGLTGANALQPEFFTGKILLNVDSEDEGVFTVGCAGGRDTRISLPLQYEDVPSGYEAWRIRASGMAGGHSGVNINDQRANALIVLSRALESLRDEIDLRIIYLGGGTAHNAIPRDAHADVYVPKGKSGQLTAGLAEMQKVFSGEFRSTDPQLALTAEAFTAVQDNRAMTVETSRRVVDLLLALPHGVAAMSTDMPGLVETSNNLANARVDDGQLRIVTSQRSSVMSRLHALTRKVETVACLAGADAVSGNGYPSWQPNLASPLLARCQDVYRRLYGKEPHVEAIHAGLECGIIGDKKPGMDMISFGPTLKNPHSPDERVHVGSIGMVWDFLAELLKSFR
jgi:dipeptidase D